jgi:hypothetical protein
VIEILAVTAAVLGFIFEWRRDSRRDDEVGTLRGRVDALEEQVAGLQAWRDRIARSQ